MTHQNDNQSAQLNLDVIHLPSETIAGHKPELFKAGLYRPRGYKLAAVHALHLAAIERISLTEKHRQCLRYYLCDFPELVAEVRELRPELLEM